MGRDVFAPTWVKSILLLVVAAVATMLFVPFAKWLARKTGAIDYPSARRVNTDPIPRLGGVAMFLGLAAALAVALALVFLLVWETPFGIHTMLDDINYVWLAISALVMFSVGLADDIVRLNPKVKFVGQLLAAGLACASGLLVTGMQAGGHFVTFGWVAYPLTVLYLVAFANVINLIDGLDGLASGIVAISAASILVLAIATGQVAAAFLCAGLIGACIGFLRYNFHPASIFMGDSGSLLLGFSLGCASLLAVAKSALVVSLLVPVVAAGIPVVDTGAAIVRRVRGHRPIDEADRGHLHHRLLEAGYSQRTTVLIMWAWTALLSAAGVLLVYASGWTYWLIVAVIVALAGFIIIRFHVLRPTTVHGYDTGAGAPAEAEAGALVDAPVDVLAGAPSDANHLEDGQESGDEDGQA